jgi:uncharacterized protein YuzE
LYVWKTAKQYIMPFPTEGLKRFEMKLNYDLKTDSLYIELSGKPSVDSNEVSDGIVLDFDSVGTLVGIDVQYASQNIDRKHLETSS